MVASMTEIKSSVLLTNVPSITFNSPEYKLDLHCLLDNISCCSYTSIEWIPTSNQILVHYNDQNVAKISRDKLDGIFFHGSNLRAFHSAPTTTTAVSTTATYLQVPDIEKQFLISPPSSPPLGWVQIRENGPIPKSEAHADDIETCIVAPPLCLGNDTPGKESLTHFSFSTTQSSKLKDVNPQIIIHDCDMSTSTPSNHISFIPKTRMP